MNVHTRLATKVLLGAVLAATALAGCSDNPGGGATGPIGSGVAPGESQEEAKEAEARRGGRAEGSIVIGDLNKPKSAEESGSPFDLCSLKWEDFPAAVRPTDGKPHTPTARTPEADDPFAAKCLYDNSADTKIDMDTGATSSAGIFMASVVWGEKLDADPSKRTGATPKSWNERAGLITTFDDPKHGKACLGLVTLSKGVAGVSITNSRFKDVDPCAVVDALLNVVTARAK